MAAGHDGPPAGTDFQIQQNVTWSTYHYRLTEIHAIIPLNPRHAHRDFPPTSLPRHWTLSVRTLQSHPPSQPVEIDQRPPSHPTSEHISSFSALSRCRYPPLRSLA
ncbi:hypothetical protein BDN71DRAFT_1455976, partial [Pleurotus eryngii]